MTNNTTADTTAKGAGGGGVDLSARLRQGCVVHARRWSGDTHDDLGGTIREAETDSLMGEAADCIDTLRAQLEAAEAEVRAIWDAMPATLRYLDLPDGGDVPLPEQVRRMGEDVVNQQARAEAAEALAEARHVEMERLRDLGARLREDAARYRWLRNEANTARRSDPMVVTNPLGPAHAQELISDLELDAAIDAARTKEADHA